jgi:hypothetical protein
MKIIGIDPGVHTGFAVWLPEHRRFELIETMSIHRAMWLVLESRHARTLNHVVFEDARMRTWFGDRDPKKDRDRLMGAGSVRRDCQIWAEFLGDSNIPYRTLSPKQKGEKVDAAMFRRLSGWQQQTNEHGRDAGMLVLGSKAMRSDA